jgi:hypothetical protein
MLAFIETQPARRGALLNHLRQVARDIDPTARDVLQPSGVFGIALSCRSWKRTEAYRQAAIAWEREQDGTADLK